MDGYRKRRDALLANLRANAGDARERLALSEDDVELLAAVPRGSLLAIQEGRDTGLVGPDLQRIAQTLGLTAEGKPRL